MAQGVNVVVERVQDYGQGVNVIAERVLDYGPECKCGS